jgi:hypothetical protein
MMKKIIAGIAIVFLILSCNYSPNENISAQSIVNKAIDASGKAKLKNIRLSFEFRGKTYQSTGQCNDILLKRIDETSEGKITDILESSGKFSRYIEDSLIAIPDSMALKYSESINSVHYFVQLPFRLNDDAVQKSYLGLDTINSKVYHNIEVSFKQKGGGTDYQDVYLYWFDEKDFKLDYLAYSFIVNGGGIRFREAYNERTIEGIRFVDYKNYKPKSDTVELRDISKAYQNNQLELLSKIENENIKVEILDEDC